MRIIVVINRVATVATEASQNTGRRFLKRKKRKCPRTLRSKQYRIQADNRYPAVTYECENEICYK